MTSFTFWAVFALATFGSVQASALPPRQAIGASAPGASDSALPPRQAIGAIAPGASDSALPPRQAIGAIAPGDSTLSPRQAIGASAPGASTTMVTVMATPSSHLESREDNYGSYCSSNVDNGLAGHYMIRLEGWGSGGQYTCGQGLREKIHNVCGQTTEWTCDANQVTDGGAVIAFQLDDPEYAYCLYDAVWQASPPQKRETGFSCECPTCHHQ